MERTRQELLNEVDEKLAFGEKLIASLNEIQSVEGVAKLQRKIRQELAFLKKLKSAPAIKKEQLSCSNLRHLAAIVNCALRPGVISVCKVINSTDGSKLHVDVISDNGKIWTKVIARNPRSLSALSKGDASYGSRSILDQAKDYISSAKMHPCFYQTPNVVFEFVSGIDEKLANKLLNIGINVIGELIPSSETAEYEDDDDISDDSDSDDSDDGFSDSDQETQFYGDVRTDPSMELTGIIERDSLAQLNTLNLDVTTMMAFISNLTNGSYNFVFKQPLLSQQAAWEAKRPVKPVLERLFEGKTLVCCETAWSDFDKILTILGGENEKKRAEELRQRLTIIEDVINGPDEKVRADLKVRGRVRLRSKIVFNFGQRIKALTVSANEGFVRAAKQQGINYAAFIHESRALTEQKEATAQPSKYT